MREHGTRAKYVAERCRCIPCREANQAYARGRYRKARRVTLGIEEPDEVFVDPTEAATHVEWLRRNGVGLRAIADTAGVSRSALHRIATGDRTRILATTADRILAVPRTSAAPGAVVDATRAIGYINDLRYLGYKRAHIATMLGRADIPTGLDRGRITAANATRIHQLWERCGRDIAPWHGTYTGYAKRGCRCLRCRAAAREQAAQRRAAA